jgi:hypothetical protein
MRNRKPFWWRPLLGALTMIATALPSGADPILTYSTYLGGSRRDVGSAVAVHEGSTFIAGFTHSLDFPIFTGSSAVSTKPSRDEFTADLFVTRLGPSGTLSYSTYVPAGNDSKTVVGIGAGPDGSAYVVAASLRESLNIVIKLGPGGSILWTREVYGRIYFRGMTVDSQGNVYLTGYDNSESPTGPAYVDRAFAWKISGSDGSTIYWAPIDGNNFESGYGIAVDATGHAYVTGATLSNNLPRAIQAVPAGSYTAFVTKLDPSGSVHWSTYLGGNGEDWGRKIAVAADDTVVVAGTTRSTNFPTENAIQTELRGPQDLFVARLRFWGSQISATYLGGSGTDEIRDLELEPSSILLAVASPEAGSPLREPLDPSCGPSFLAKLDAAASRVLDAACLGSSTIEGVAADASGISLTGAAGSDLPLANAWQPSPGGEGDAFAAKLVLNHAPDCSAATASPDTLWPADRSFVPVSVSGVTDLEGDPVTIAFLSIFQDEWFTYSGQADATGLGTSTAHLRAARISGGNGRVYHLEFTATDSRGGACTGLVKVCVPPVQGGTCIDGGPRVNSTQPY